MHAPTPVLSKLAPHLHMRATQESTLARLAALLFLAAAPMEISASVTAHDCTPVSLCPGRRMLPMGHASRLNIHGSFWASARDSPQIEAGRRSKRAAAGGCRLGGMMVVMMLRLRMGRVWLTLRDGGEGRGGQREASHFARQVVEMGRGPRGSWDAHAR